MQPSRSEKKRQAKRLELLIGELAGLSPGEIEALPCDREIKEQIASARGLKGGARKRQLKYAAKLLRNRPVEPLYDFMADKKGSALKEKHDFHELEHLRNLLLDEAVLHYEEQRKTDGFVSEKIAVSFPADSRAIEIIGAHLPQVDLNQLKDVALQFARTRNRRFSRELFRIMRAAREKAQYLSEAEN